MNLHKKDEEKYKKKTITLINTIKSHYDKERRDAKKHDWQEANEATRKQNMKKLKAIEEKIEESLINLNLNKKVLEEIIRKIGKQLKFMDDKEIKKVKKKTYGDRRDRKWSQNR